MPKICGLEAAKILRLMQENGQIIGDPKIVLLTGEDQMLSNDLAVTVFDQIIIKPIK